MLDIQSCLPSTTPAPRITFHSLLIHKGCDFASLFLASERRKCWDTALTTVPSCPPLSGCLTWEKLSCEGNHCKNWMAIEWLPASSQTPACHQELGPPLPPLACHDFTLHDNPTFPTLTPPPQDDQASVRQLGWLSFLLLPWVPLLPVLLLTTPPLSFQTSPQKLTDFSPTEGTPWPLSHP